MCDFGASTFLAALSAGGAGAAAGGAAAGAATAGAAAAGSAISAATVLQTVGAVIGIAAPLIQARNINNAAEENVELIETQKTQTAQLATIKDVRERQQFRAAIAKQRAELASRGVQLDSSTAVLLGQTAAEEMAFNSASIQTTGQSRIAELTAEQRATRARGQSALISGDVSAAGTLLTAAPDLWPELLA